MPSDTDASTYEGFDWNNDPHSSFASNLLNDAGLYVEAAPDKNSHSIATIDRYRRMLRSWKRAADKYRLTKAEAEAIITA